MVEIRRLSEQDIYDNFTKLRELIGQATKRGGGSINDYTRLMLNSIANPNVLAAGVFQNGALHGMFLAITGMSYFTPDTAAYLVLLSLDNTVSLKEAYQQSMQLIKSWMNKVGANMLICSSPRHGFSRLIPRLDSRWRVHEILVLKTE